MPPYLLKIEYEELVAEILFSRKVWKHMQEKWLVEAGASDEVEAAGLAIVRAPNFRPRLENVRWRNTYITVEGKDVKLPFLISLSVLGEGTE